MWVVNQVQLAGWLEDEPEGFEGGVRLTLRVPRSDDRGRFDLIEVVAFRGVGTVARHEARPGRPVAIAGRLEERRGHDQDGEWSEVRVVATGIDFFDAPGPDGAAGPPSRHFGDTPTQEVEVAVLDSIIDEVLGSIDADERAHLRDSYPMLPASVDRMLLRTTGARLTSEVGQPIRRQLRDRFWARINDPS